MSEPPVTKYELTLTIHGNSHDEIERELLGMTRGGYLHDSDYLKRDEFHVVGGRRTSILKHTNPDMTPERYEAELDAWFRERQAMRRADRERRTTPPQAEPSCGPETDGTAPGGRGDRG